MNVGVVREVKHDEHRVAVTPAGAHDLVEAGHRVLVESGAGAGSLLPDDEYAAGGAEIVADAASVWSEADVVCKVKEPQQEEFGYLRDGLVLFTYLHLAAYPEVADALCRSRTVGIAYETVQMPDGSLPLLAPMSEVAGRMAPQVGAHALEAASGGRGVLLGGVPGVEPSTVVVIGGGMAGSNAARIALGMGADVHVLDLNPSRLREIDNEYHGAIRTAMSSPYMVRELISRADLVIGAVLLPGARAPRVLSAEDLGRMRPGAVLVDIAIDQGGCFETSHETKHSDPIYIVDGIVHYAVGNIPGAVPRTSTFALSNVTLPYLMDLAELGLDGAVARRHELAGGINTRNGTVVNATVARALA